MKRSEILDKIAHINVWSRGDERAPHKPLLLLYALSKLACTGSRSISYDNVDDDLKNLLVEFGPPRGSYHTEYPFWRLQNDGIWKLWNADHLNFRKNNTDAKKSELLKHNVMGGFSDEVYEQFKKDKGLINEVVGMLLEDNFPTSLHEDILSAIGFCAEENIVVARPTNVNFRQRILVAYEYNCAICGFNVRLGASDIALEAAHIKWRQASGPNIESNGLALCALHHKLFDRGALTISEDHRILISELVSGTSGFQEWLLRFHGSPMRLPQSPHYYPLPEHVGWHFEQVFKQPARYIDPGTRN